MVNTANPFSQTMTSSGYESENALLCTEVKSAPIDGKGFVPDEIRTQIFRKLRTRQENRTCFDCPARNPTWISLSHGCYVCLVCSGEHRRMGVHISFVRSVELDSFNPDQLMQMILGGNGRARQFYKSIGVDAKRKENVSGARSVDYYDKSSLKFRKQLEKDTINECAKRGVQCNIKGGRRSPAGSPVASVNLQQFREPVQNPQAGFNQADGTWSLNPSAGAGGPGLAALEKSTSKTSAGSTDDLAKELFGSSSPKFANREVDLFASAGDKAEPFSGPGLALAGPAAPRSYTGAPTPKSMGTGSGGLSAVGFNPVGKTADGGVHFSAGGGQKVQVAQARDLDADFDFDFLEDEAQRVVPVTEMPVTENSRKVEQTYGLPPTAAAVPVQVNPPRKNTPPQRSADDSIVRNNFAADLGLGRNNPFANGGSSSAGALQQQAPASTEDFAHRKGFGSDDMFGGARAEEAGPSAVAAGFATKQAFGSDAFFGRKDSSSSTSSWNDRHQGPEFDSERAKEMARKSLERGSEIASAGAAKAKELWANYMQRS